jgi:hypothetical protein
MFFDVGCGILQKLRILDRIYRISWIVYCPHAPS